MVVEVFFNVEGKALRLATVLRAYASHNESRLSVGARVGNAVGSDLEGRGEGRYVLLTPGSNGDNVGSDVGVFDGRDEGHVVGCIDGTLDGRIIGWDEGWPLGWHVGCLEGWDDGCLEG